MKNSALRVACIIPSRINSTRLPRKPLALIQSKPMIQWVYERAIACPDISEVLVATDCEEIQAVIQVLGGKAVLTDPSLKTGSDRVAAAAATYCPDAEVVINLQGDEPFMRPEMLSQLLTPYLSGDSPESATLAGPLDEVGYQDPNIVKVVTDKKGDALLFSRAPIPYFRDTHVELKEAPVYRHQGVYAYRSDFLQAFSKLPQTALERVELLEQLRVLEHGYRMKVTLTSINTLEINTPCELAKAQSYSF